MNSKKMLAIDNAKEIFEKENPCFEQMNIWEIIKELEKCDKKSLVFYDNWEYTYTKINSWRWDYGLLALWYTDSYSSSVMNVKDVIKSLKSVLWTELPGYKWWKFYMDEYTDVYVANYWDCTSWDGERGIYKVKEENWIVLLLTKEFPY